MRIKAVIIIILLSVIVFGCKKKKEVQIVGSWLEVPMTEQPDEYGSKWTFIEDGTIEMYYFETFIDTGEYTLVYKFPQYYVDIKGLTIPGDNVSGRFRIDQLDDDFLKINRIEKEDGSTGGAFKRYEFMRE